MKKFKLFILILPVLLFVFLFKTAAVASAACDGSLSYPGRNTCTTRYPNHSLNATWNVTPPAPPGTCNIFIQGDAGDRQIITSCNGSTTITSYNGAPLTNDGHYKLFVSNGSAECTNQQKDDVTIPCAVGNCSATIEEARRQLIAAGGNYQNATCDEVKNKVCTDCTIFVPPNAIRTALCPGTCGGGTPAPPGTRSCSVSWNLSNPNPAPNSGMTVEVTGISDSGGWQNIQLSRDNQNVCPQGAGCSLNIQPGPKFIFSNVNSGSSGSHTLSFATDNGATKCPQTKTYTAGVAATTVSYRIAESLADLKKADWKDYTVVGMTIDYDFKTSGQKFIFVEFKDSKGKTGGCGDNQNQPCQAEIRVLGPDPKVTSCVLSFEGVNTVLNLTGQNFGSDKGTVKSGETSLQVREWKDATVRAVWQNAPEGKVLPVILTNPYGQTAESQCSSISQLALGAKVFCRAPSNHQTDNADLTLVGDYEGGSRVKQKVSIDKDGVIQGLTQKLEAGKKYKLSVKAPKSLRKLASFTAGEGVTTVPNFVLPVGDIFPADVADGSINSLDKAELNRQWIISVDAAGRSGDFNKDSRVNSIDWACMRYDFGKPEDPEPAAGNLPAPSPSPTPNSSVREV